MRDDVLTHKQIRVLNSRTPQTLARWWCRLNAWQWPRGLPGKEDRFASHSLGNHNPVRTAIMDWIIGRVGRRRALQTWWREFATKKVDG